MHNVNSHMLFCVAAASDNFDKWDEDSDMPPKKAPLPAAASKARASAKSSGNGDVDDLVGRLKEVSVTPKAYSTKTLDPSISRIFTEDEVQYVEVDVLVGAGSLVGDITATLSKDGESLCIARGSIAAFFKLRRVRKTTEKYDADSSRIVAHRRAVDEFTLAESGNIVNGVIYPKDIQSIKLPAKCTGLVVQRELSFFPTSVKCTLPANGLHATDTVHQQFVAVVTFRMKTVEQLQEVKKAIDVKVRGFDITDEYDSD